MNDGFILLSRTLLDSDVFASQKLLKIWIWCLLKANFKDRHVPLKIGKGETIVNVKRGSFLFGRFKAEEELFIDGSTVYKSMQKLQKMGMIKINSNNQYSLITICKYDEYQQTDNYKVTTKGQPSNNQVTAKGQPSNTTKNYNNDNNDNNVCTHDFFEKEDFVDWFNASRKYLGLESNIVKLSPYEVNLFDNLKNDYRKDDFKKAFRNFSSDDYYSKKNLIFPNHFLKAENFVKYLNDKPKEELKTGVNLGLKL